MDYIDINKLQFLWGRAMARPYRCGILDGVYDNWDFFCMGRCAHRPNI